MANICTKYKTTLTWIDNGFRLPFYLVVIFLRRSAEELQHMRSPCIGWATSTEDCDLVATIPWCSLGEYNQFCVIQRSGKYLGSIS